MRPSQISSRQGGLTGWKSAMPLKIRNVLSGVTNTEAYARALYSAGSSIAFPAGCHETPPSEEQTMLFDGCPASFLPPIR